MESTDDNSAPQKWTVSSTIRDAFTTVKDNIKYNVYKKTSDFADNIRSMFREEFTYFLETLWENTVGMPSQPGELVKLDSTRTYYSLPNCYIYSCSHFISLHIASSPVIRSHHVTVLSMRND